LAGVNAIAWELTAAALNGFAKILGEESKDLAITLCVPA
jgi:hypothetical protein